MTQPIGQLAEKYPVVHDFLRSYGLNCLDPNLPLMDAVEQEQPNFLQELGMTPLDFANLLWDILQDTTLSDVEKINSIEITGGADKDMVPESVSLTIRTGEVVSVVGPTGSGKSQLLADIECAARGDTPSGRTVRFNGKELRDEQRFSLGNRLVAQLTQNMNFVLDATVEEFLRMHAQCRQLADPDPVIARCFQTANALSGEPFGKTTKVTRLSGGQARALMISDAACISPSPILLIDEIENAGIDRTKAIEILTSEDKIVLLATHDPLLALSAGKRVVLHNGGIRAVLETDDKEREELRRLQKEEQRNAFLRDALRTGERIQ